MTSYLPYENFAKHTLAFALHPLFSVKKLKKWDNKSEGKARKCLSYVQVHVEVSRKESTLK